MTASPTDSTLATPERVWLAGPLMVLLGGCALGFAPIGLRLGLGELGPQAIAFWRYLFAIPMLLALVVLFNRRLPALPNRALCIAAVCFTLDMALWHWSLTATTVSNATFIVNLGNIGVGLAAWVFFRQAPGANWIVAALLAMAGAAALSLGGASLAAISLKGDAAALLAAVFVAGYMLWSKEARRTMNGLDAIFWLSVIEAALAAPIVWLTGEVFLPAHLSGFLAPLILAVVVQTAGQGLIITGIGSTSAAIAGILTLSQPVVAALIAWRLFDEPLTALQLAGAGVILFAVWLAQRPARKRLAGVTETG